MRLYYSLVALVGIFILQAGLASAVSVSFFFDTQEDADFVSTSSELVRSESVLFQVITDSVTSCRYSSFDNVPYGAMEGSFDLSFDTVHKKTFTELDDGVYRYYVRCKDSSNVESVELETVFSVSVPISANIVLEEDSPLKDGNYEISLVTSKVVSETPSLSYSFDGVSYNVIPLFGSGTQWQGYIALDDSEGEEIGSFKFSGKDLEGYVGTHISSGGSFIVDTIYPSTIVDIDAEGREEGIFLNWYYPDEDIKTFNIYRSKSSGVTRADFFININEDSDYIDTAVEKGETYYYRISGIDLAGNEAPLSREVFDTVLLGEVQSSSSGLEPRFHGTVDNFLIEADFVIDDLDAIKDKFESSSGSFKDLYDDLKLSRELDSAKSEIKSLRGEGENLKLQSLSQTELDKKLNSHRLRLNALKTKVPESISVVENEDYNPEITEDDLLEMILKMYPDLDQSSSKEVRENSLAAIESSGFSVERSVFNIDVIYLDGSSKEFTLVRESIGSSLENSEDYLVVESIPREIISSLDSVDIKNQNYDIDKPTSSINFDSTTSSIVYSFEDHSDLGLMSRIDTLLIFKYDEKENIVSENKISGFISFAELGSNGGYFGIIVGILVIAGLFGYLYLMKKGQKSAEVLISLRKKLDEVEDHISKGWYSEAQKEYDSLAGEYALLGKKEKQILIGDLEELSKKLSVELQKS